MIAARHSSAIEYSGALFEKSCYAFEPVRSMAEPRKRLTLTSKAIEYRKLGVLSRCQNARNRGTAERHPPSREGLCFRDRVCNDPIDEPDLQRFLRVDLS